MEAVMSILLVLIGLLLLVRAIITYHEASCEHSCCTHWISLEQIGAKNYAYWSEQLRKRNEAQRAANREEDEALKQRLGYYHPK